MNLQPTQRHLALAGTYNIRDLGGYLTRDGQVTSWRSFLRADALHRLSPVAQQQLLDLGVRTIIDLRFPSEVESEPNVFVGKNLLNYHHLSLMSGIFNDQPVPSNGGAMPSLESIYRSVLDRGQLTLRTVFEVMSDEKDGAVLFHCTAGKDRTGLVAALLLGLVGVEKRVIAEDYALTEQYLNGLKVSLRAKAAAAGQDVTTYDHMLESKPEAMINTLDYLEANYSSVPDYLRQIGLSNARLNYLRRQLLG